MGKDLPPLASLESDFPAADFQRGLEEAQRFPERGLFLPWATVPGRRAHSPPFATIPPRGESFHPDCDAAISIGEAATRSGIPTEMVELPIWMATIPHLGPSHPGLRRCDPICDAPIQWDVPLEMRSFPTSMEVPSKSV